MDPVIAEKAKKARDKLNLDQLKKFTEEERREFYHNVLLVLDDVVADVKK